MIQVDSKKVFKAGLRLLTIYRSKPASHSPLKESYRTGRPRRLRCSSLSLPESTDAHSTTILSSSDQAKCAGTVQSALDPGCKMKIQGSETSFFLRSAFEGGLTPSKYIKYGIASGRCLSSYWTQRVPGGRGIFLRQPKN